MEHPLPTGIFTEMLNSSSDKYDNWTEEDFHNEIIKLRERIKELESQKVERIDYEEVILEEDDDDIMYDPDIRDMVENGEHTCHMFDAHCQACEDDED
tara:strand:- start:239 stop:532 length:294 start_codon:yes stop_codon:yes gene_type:complete